MKTVKSPKFELGIDDESNLGHTKDEWGNKEGTPKIRIMEMYDLKWNIDKNNDD